MPIASSHHPDKRRYFGEHFAKEVVDFLTDNPFQLRLAARLAKQLSPEYMVKRTARIQRGRQRVINLIDCLKSIYGKPFRGTDKVSTKKFNRCNRLLVRYKVRWLVGPAWENEVGSLDEEALSRAAFGFVELVVPRGNVTAEECHAVRGVMRLAELGALKKLRTCKHCGAWFYAKFEHQQFCAKNCQVKHNAASDQWKEYKRNKAREYYHLHKSGKVRER